MAEPVSAAERKALIRTFVRDAEMKLRAAMEVAEAGIADEPAMLPDSCAFRRTRGYLTDALKTTERALQALKD